MTNSFPRGEGKSYIWHYANSVAGVDGQDPDSDNAANVPVEEKVVDWQTTQDFFRLSQLFSPENVVQNIYFSRCINSFLNVRVQMNTFGISA